MSIKRYTLEENDKCLTVTVSLEYENGGFDIFAGSKIPEGYYLVVKPSSIKKDKKEERQILTGFKRLFEGAKRFTEERAKELTSIVKEENYIEMFKKVLKKNNLEYSQINKKLGITRSFNLPVETM